MQIIILIPLGTPSPSFDVWWKNSVTFFWKALGDLRLRNLGEGGLSNATGMKDFFSQLLESLPEEGLQVSALFDHKKITAPKILFSSSSLYSMTGQNGGYEYSSSSLKFETTLKDCTKSRTSHVIASSSCWNIPLCSILPPSILFTRFWSQEYIQITSFPVPVTESDSYSK